MNLTSGEIRIAAIPFKDQPAQAKRRPVVVIGWSPMGAAEDEVVLVVPITSYDGQPKPRNGDLPIDWQAAGLQKQSWVRARRLWHADPKSLSHKAIGKVSDNEYAMILLEIESLF